MSEDRKDMKLLERSLFMWYRGTFMWYRGRHLCGTEEIFLKDFSEFIESLEEFCLRY